jgi:PAS domain S-box-containing protein
MADSLYENQKELQRSKERFKLLSSVTFEGIVIHNKGVVRDVNESFLKIFGVNFDDIFDKNCIELLFPSESKFLIYENHLKDVSIPYEVMGRKKNGTLFPVEIESRELKENNEDIWVSAVRDITLRKKDQEEKKELMTKLQQAQKMKSIGTLAGGIAHDFNNVLSVIIGYSEMAKNIVSKEPNINRYLDSVLVAADRARKLVDQILTFSRQSNSEFIPIQIQPLLKEDLKFLRSTIPTSIKITENIVSDCKTILGDPTQIHQIIVNLCTNSYHSMEESGGTLHVSLRNSIIGPENNKSKNLSPGEYLEISVSDTGCGINPEILDKIFEPYFTTKPPGKGTGMGLAIVHGIINDHGGSISVKSQLGIGSEFTILLPSIQNNSAPKADFLNNAPIGTDRILLIDDEKGIAEMSKEMLEGLGYHVSIQLSSVHALKEFEKSSRDYDIVITDQTMPDMTGVELAQKMLVIRPDIPIIICTGYSAHIDKKSVQALGIKGFAMKPMAKLEIANLIRKVLD